MKEIIKATQQMDRIIKGSSLTRIMEHRLNSHTGTISACKGKHWYIAQGILPEPTTDAENTNVENQAQKLDKARDKQLASIFKKMYPKIGYIRVYGKYKSTDDDIPSSEISYFVYTLDNSFDLKSFLLDCGRRFEQESITYADRDGQYELIASTNFTDGEGKKWSYGQVMLKFNTTIWDKNGEFNSGAFSSLNKQFNPRSKNSQKRKKKGLLDKNPRNFKWGIAMSFSEPDDVTAIRLARETEPVTLWSGWQFSSSKGMFKTKEVIPSKLNLDEVLLGD